uniref:Serine carboxypeptidase n=1 Tax=Amblyomma maculatum TaxID=34609 RepID=G3MPV6_AMBMU
MNSIILLLFVIWTVLFTTRHITRRKDDSLTEEERRQLDKPLFLTPLLESNDTERARRLSRVTLFEEHGVEAHSGYVTVHKGYGSHLFFLLTKAKHLPDTAPLILWTFGGPGVSSLLGPLLFNGPAILDATGHLKSAPGGDLQSFAHVLYLDHPVGSGYSFAEHDEDDRPFAKSVDDAVDGVDEFLRQFEILFSEFRGRQLYFAGESYSARDAFGYAYRHHSSGTKISMKLAGIMSGAGFIAPLLRSANPAKFLLKLGLIDTEGRRLLDEKFGQIKESVEDQEILVALLLLREVFFGTETGTPSLFQELTGYRHRASALRSTEPAEFVTYREYVASNDFKRAIHVGVNATPERQRSFVTNSLYAYDAFKDITDMVQTVLDHHRVLLYRGNMDVVYPPDAVYRFLRSLHWSGGREFAKARKRPYTNSSGTGEVVGYKLKVRNLTYALLVNSGHYVSFDSRRAVADLYKDFVRANVTTT